MSGRRTRDFHRLRIFSTLLNSPEGSYSKRTSGSSDFHHVLSRLGMENSGQRYGSGVEPVAAGSRVGKCGKRLQSERERGRRVRKFGEVLSDFL